MKTYKINDNNGNPFAFEIENLYISLRKIVKILSSVEGVTNINARQLFEHSRENHIEFEYFGEQFVIWEPFGDNSRYWIGPKEPEIRTERIIEIENIIKKYKPSFLVKLISDLISLNFKQIFRSKHPTRSDRD